MFHHVRLLLTILILITLLAAIRGLAEPISEEIESALVAKDWETARALLESYDLETDSVAWFIDNHCCLALDLECAFETYMSHADRPWQHGPTEEWIRNLVDRNPKNAVPWLLQGDYEARQGNIREAKRALDRALQIDPELVPALLMRGTGERFHGSEAKLRNYFERALDVDPNQGAALLNYATMMDELGNHEWALAIQERGFRTGKHIARFHYNRGNSFRSLGRNEEAVASYTAAISRDSSLMPAYHNRGNVYLDLGEVDSALADYYRTIARANSAFAPEVTRLKAMIVRLAETPHFYDSLATMSLVDQSRTLYVHAEFDKAVQAASRAIEQDSADSDAYYWRASACSMAGKLDSAIEDFSRVLARDPSNKLAWYKRGECLSEMGDYVAAQADYGGAIKCDSTFAKAYLGRGWVSDQLRDFERGRNNYEKYAALVPNYEDEDRTLVEQHLDQLIRFRKMANDHYARNLIRRAYVALAERDWETLLTCTSTRGLKDFRKEYRQHLERQLEPDGKAVVIGDRTFDVRKMLTGTDAYFMTSFLYLLRVAAETRDPSFAIDSAVVIDTRCFAEDKFLVRSRIFVTAHDEQHVLSYYDVVERHDRRWVVGSMDSWVYVLRFDRRLAWAKHWGDSQFWED